MTPQPVEGLDRGERLLQLRLAENRDGSGRADSGDEPDTGRRHGTNLRDAGGRKAGAGDRTPHEADGRSGGKSIFLWPKGKETADLSGHEDEKEDLRAGEKSGGRPVGASGL